MPSDNKQFGEMAVEVRTQVAAFWEAVSDISSIVQLFRQTAGQIIID